MAMHQSSRRTPGLGIGEVPVVDDAGQGDAAVPGHSIRRTPGNGPTMGSRGPGSQLWPSHRGAPAPRSTV